ncbi:hypothetical protein SAMD00079811_39190 [Scytonema sp. HK-05]|nr:hypothetical protein SAMD00079811_39190 [Scytonema sp. HK-05]
MFVKSLVNFTDFTLLFHCIDTCIYRSLKTRARVRIVQKKMALALNLGKEQNINWCTSFKLLLQLLFLF